MKILYFTALVCLIFGGAGDTNRDGPVRIEVNEGGVAHICVNTTILNISYVRLGGTKQNFNAVPLYARVDKNGRFFEINGTIFSGRLKYDVDLKAEKACFFVKNVTKADNKTEVRVNYKTTGTNGPKKLDFKIHVMIKAGNNNKKNNTTPMRPAGNNTNQTNTTPKSNGTGTPDSGRKPIVIVVVVVVVVVVLFVIGIYFIIKKIREKKNDQRVQGQGDCPREAANGKSNKGQTFQKEEEEEDLNDYIQLTNSTCGILNDLNDVSTSSSEVEENKKIREKKNDQRVQGQGDCPWEAANGKLNIGQTLQKEEEEEDLNDENQEKLLNSNSCGISRDLN